MTLTLDDNAAQYQIRAYQPGMIQVNENTFTRSLIITPHQLIDDWPPQTLHDLTHDHLKVVKTLKPTILLIGTGESLIFPSIDIYGDLINEKIGVEIMDTRAACRTYNALAAENREVVAALIIS